MQFWYSLKQRFTLKNVFLISAGLSLIVLWGLLARPVTTLLYAGGIARAFGLLIARLPDVTLLLGAVLVLRAVFRRLKFTRRYAIWPALGLPVVAFLALPTLINRPVLALANAFVAADTLPDGRKSPGHRIALPFRLKSPLKNDPLPMCNFDCRYFLITKRQGSVTLYPITKQPGNWPIQPLNVAQFMQDIPDTAHSFATYQHHGAGCDYDIGDKPAKTHARTDIGAFEIKGWCIGPVPNPPTLDLVVTLEQAHLVLGRATPQNGGAAITTRETIRLPDSRVMSAVNESAYRRTPTGPELIYRRGSIRPELATAPLSISKLQGALRYNGTDLGIRRVQTKIEGRAQNMQLYNLLDIATP